jgi:molecular chaperone GrpE (heat shock protein)
MSEALGNIDAKIDAKLGSDMEKYDAAAEKLQAKVDDDLATIEGDINAAEENVRLAKERKNSKLNATRLKLQMHQEEVKNRIEAKKTAIDKDAQEELIMDLLDYADDCQQIAYSYVMEAELAILDACDEIEEYEAKYGKFEPEEK